MYTLLLKKAPYGAFFYCLLLVALYLAPLFFVDFYQHDIQRLSVLILSLVSLMLCGTYLVRQHLDAGLLLIILISIAVVLIAYFQGFLHEEWLHLAIVGLTLFLFSRSRCWSGYLLVGVVSLSLAQALLSLSSLLGSIAIHEPVSLNDLAEVYSNYRFLNHVHTVWIPLLVVALYQLAQGKKWLIFCIYALLIFHCMLVLQMGARATMLALSLSLLIIIFLFRWRSVDVIKHFLIAGILGLVLKLLIFDVGMNTAGPQAQMSALSSRIQQVDQPRLQLWHRAWVGVQRSSWWGHGPSSFAQYEQLQQDIVVEPRLAGVGFHGAHPHNIYLQIAYEWGVPVLILFLIMLGVFFKKMTVAIKKQADLKQQQVGMCLLIGTLAVCMDGLFSGNFVMPVSQFWIAALFGLALKWLYEMKSTAITLSVRKMQNGLFLFLGCGALAVVHVAALFPEVRHLNTYLENNEKIFYTGQRNPRFWSHGWF